METRNSTFRQRMYELDLKAKQGAITPAEKDELMNLLYQHKYITDRQLSRYKEGRNADNLMKTVFAVAAMIGVGYLLDKAISSK